MTQGVPIFFSLYCLNPYFLKTFMLDRLVFQTLDLELFDIMALPVNLSPIYLEYPYFWAS